MPKNEPNQCKITHCVMLDGQKRTVLKWSELQKLFEYRKNIIQWKLTKRS